VAVAEQRRKKRDFTFHRAFTSAVGFEQKIPQPFLSGLMDQAAPISIVCACACILYILYNVGQQWSGSLLRRVGSTLHPRPSITPRLPPSTLVLFAAFQTRLVTIGFEKL